MWGMKESLLLKEKLEAKIFLINECTIWIVNATKKHN